MRDSAGFSPASLRGRYRSESYGGAGRPYIWDAMRRHLFLLAGAVLAATTAGGCASPDAYRESRTRADLRAAGLDAREAECVVDEMDETFGFQRLSAREEPTELEREAMDDILAECLGDDRSR